MSVQKEPRAVLKRVTTPLEAIFVPVILGIVSKMITTLALVSMTRLTFLFYTVTFCRY